MKAIILAAGKGTRLRPLTDTLPKPMVPLAGRPLLEHIIDRLPEEIDELYIVVGYKKELIQKHFGSSYKERKIVYVEQKEQLGTGHAAMLCTPYFKEGEKFALLYADDLHDKESIAACLTDDLSLLVKEVADPRKFGVVIQDEHGYIKDIEEKPEQPKSRHAVVGFYLLDTRIFSCKPTHQTKGEYYLTDMIADLIREHKVRARKTAFWHPIGYPEDLRSAEELILHESRLV